QLPALRELLPFEVKPGQHSGLLPLTWPAREASQTSTLSGSLGQRGGTFPLAQLTQRPNRPSRVIIPPPDPNSTVPPKNIYAGQAAVGLGKITVIGFDLDRPPFTDFTSRPEFWDWVLRDGGASRASTGDEKPRPASTTPSEEEDKVGVALRTY